MKRIVLIVWVLVALLAACTSKKQVPEPVEWSSKELTAIDSLMWQQPDSALMRLLPWFDTCCRDAARHVSTATAYDRHYANLLLSELLYKNDNPQFNRSDLLLAVAYFDSLSLTLSDTPHAFWSHCGPLFRECGTQSPTRNDNLPFLAARAHYMNGVGYYENDSAVPACKEYMKALEIMEDHFKEKDLVGDKAKFMALAYTRLTMLFSDLYLHEQAVYFGELALNYYDCYDTYAWHKAWILDEIGSHFEMIEQLDSACYYYQKAATSLNDTNVLMYRDIKTHQAHLKYKTGGRPEVSIQQLHGLLSKAENDRDSLARLLALGEIYYYEKQYDSAWFFLNIVYRKSSSIGSKKQAAEWLIEICKAQTSLEDVDEYTNFLVPYANLEQNESSLKSQYTELYKTYNERKQEQHHWEERKENLRWTAALFLGFLALFIVIVVLYRKNKSERRYLEKQVKEKQFSYEIQQKSLSGRLKKSNESLREALLRIEGYEAERSIVDIGNVVPANGKERYDTFKQTPICIEILDRTKQLCSDKRKVLKTDTNISDYKAFALSDAQLVALLKAVESCFPEIIDVWKSYYPALNRKDMHYLSLYLLQIDKMCICIFLQDSYHTCRRYTMKFERVFNCQYGLAAFLLDQINAL
jgi:hypothetical protein